MTVARSQERPQPPAAAQRTHLRAVPAPEGGGDPTLTSALTELFDVVTGEAPLDELDDILTRLHTVTGPLGADPRAVDRAAQRAFRAVQAHRRSEQSLLALHETTAELGALDALGALYEGIVRLLVRLVPGTDLAWLEVLDGPEVLRSRAEWGLTVSRPTLAPGTVAGLGAFVLRTGSPLAVESYLESAAFEHHPLLDAHARAEEMNCVLAVPLSFRGAVGAVLYAARRDARPFTRDEISLAQRFARSASAPLAAALALSDSERLRGLLAQRMRTRDAGAAMVDTLLAMVSAADLPSLPDVAAVLGQGLDAAVVLLDGQDVLLCQTGPVPAGGPVTEAIRRVRLDPGQVFAAGGADGTVIYAVACGGGPESAGVLLAVRDAALSRDAVRDLRRAAQALTVIRVRQDAVLRAHTEVRAELLTELLSTRQALPQSTRVLAGARRLRLDRDHVVVAVGAAVPETAIGDIAQNLGGVGGRYADTLVAVVPGTDARAAADEISARLKRVGVRPPVCAADPVDPAGGGLAGAFDSARHGLRLLTALGRPDHTATVGELSLYRLLFDAERAGDVRSFLDGVLRPLQDYDREHRTDLVTTVRVFLATGCNATQAARELYIHLNTMAKRLERVTRLLGDDWQNGPDNLRLRLALHLHALTEAG